MKTPRVHDFDPNAKVPELKSPLDGMPTIQKPKLATDASSTERSNARTPEQVNESTPVRPNDRANERPNRIRQTKRQSYEFYVDQIEAIRLLAREEEDRGGRDNKSKIVREAIDEYLARRTNRTPERSNDR